MKDIVLKRCCGNCEWSISPECEEEIMEELYYDKDDPNRPRAGDCCLGMEHDEEYFCNHHAYTSVGLETYVFYDDNDLGPGYYVVTEYYDNIIRYLKLYRVGQYGEYNYGIRAYEINPITSNYSLDICFEVTEVDNKLLYKLLNIFAKTLGNDVIRNNNGDNSGFITADNYKGGVAINFSKIMNDKDNFDNFIDIKIKCNKEDKNYKLMEHLFRNMAVATANMANNNAHKKVRAITKKK